VRIRLRGTRDLPHKGQSGSNEDHGNREFLDATLAWHDLLQHDAMQPSGVPVADEYYGPTGAFRGTETCDVAGYLWSQIVLLTISGQARMADWAERAFFNAGPATVARDFRTHAGRKLLKGVARPILG
jgi:hypothetical protein